MHIWTLTGAAALLLAAGPSYAHAPDDATACERALTAGARDAEDRLKIGPEIRARVDGADHRLLVNVVDTLARLDDQTLELIAREVIENPPPADDAVVKANSFFADHPAAATPFARVTYEILRGMRLPDLDEYQLGLLAALVPVQERVDNSSPLKKDKVSAAVRMTSKYAELISRPEYRGPLLDLLDRLFDRGIIATIHFYKMGMPTKALEDVFNYENMRRSVDRIRAGRISTRDAVILSTTLNALYNQIPAANDDNSAGLRFEKLPDGTAIRILRRDFGLFIVERYLGEKLRIESSMSALMTAFGVICYLDPLPMTARRLRQGLLANADRLVGPVRLRARKTEDLRTIPAWTPAPAAPPSLNLKDHFAPAPQKQRRRANASPETESPRATAWVRPSISPERSLHDFTSFAPNPRGPEELKAGWTYEFWYMREANASVRRVRFGPDVVDWLRDHPGQARQMLNALHLGVSYGAQTGIKSLGSMGSRRFDGLVYEVKVHGKFRPLLIFVDGAWEVLRVSHKDAIAHDVTWLTPLRD